MYSKDRLAYFPAAEKAYQFWKYINLSQKYECRNWETEHYNSALEITFLFLEIHKWKPDIYIDSDRPFICSVYRTVFIYKGKERDRIIRK
jgi:hypothetical protein